MVPRLTWRSSPPSTGSRAKKEGTPVRQQQQQGHTHMCTHHSQIKSAQYRPQQHLRQTLAFTWLTSSKPQQPSKPPSTKQCGVQRLRHAAAAANHHMLLPTTPPVTQALTPGQHILSQPRVTRHHVASSVPHRPQLPGTMEARQNVLRRHTGAQPYST